MTDLFLVHFQFISLYNLHVPVNKGILQTMNRYVVPLQDMAPANNNNNNNHFTTFVWDDLGTRMSQYQKQLSSAHTYPDDQ